MLPNKDKDYADYISAIKSVFRKFNWIDDHFTIEVYNGRFIASGPNKTVEKYIEEIIGSMFDLNKNVIISFDKKDFTDIDEFKPYIRRKFDATTDKLESGCKDRNSLQKYFCERDLDTVLMMAEDGYSLTDFDIDGFELPENFWDKIYKYWIEYKDE